MTSDEAGGAVQFVPRTPNTVLRGIRENERRESQTEFAEAMAAIARETGAESYPDWKYVQRLESGHIRWPHRTYRNILEQLCGRSARELGFAPSARSVGGFGVSGEEPRHTNVELREAVWQSGMELAEFARKVGVHLKTAERWIMRGVIPQPFRRWRISLILGIDESELWPDATLPPQRLSEKPLKPPRPKFADPKATVTETAMVEEDQEEMERRRVLQSLTALGVNVSPLSQALETVRTVLGGTVGYDDRDHLDLWEETIVEYGHSYLTTFPINLIPDLAADLVSVRSIMRRIQQDSSEYRSWCRIGGALSALMAKSLSNLGQPRSSREWWSMAQHLTDASGDLNLRLWVRGEHIVHGLYENRPIQALSRQVKSAAEIADDNPCIGLVDVSGARAQVSVLAGDYQSAEEDLHKTEDILGRIPSAAATAGTGLVMGWGEAEFRYTEAWVYSHMGDEVQTDRAAEHALSLYPASDKRSPAQIRLMQAFARVRRGDITEGIRHARSVYEPLAFGRTTMVDALARQVPNSIPVQAQNRPDVADYRMIVSSRIPEGRMIEA